MKLYMKQKVFSWGDKFSVYDETGGEKYFVKGEVFSLGKRLHVFDKTQKEIAFIKRKLWTFLPKYRIEIGGNYAAEVVKHFSFTKQIYTVNGKGWEVMGNFLAHEYAVYDGTLPVATVSKEWFTWGDAYVIDIAPYADELTALCTVLVIDAALDEAGAF